MLKAHKIDNYYGFENGISGEKLFGEGLNQVLHLGAEKVFDEVTSINYEDVFKVKTAANEYNAKAIIIATRKQTQKN